MEDRKKRAEQFALKYKPSPEALEEMRKLNAVIAKKQIAAFKDDGTADACTDITSVTINKLEVQVPAYVIPQLSMIMELERAELFVVCAKAGLLIHMQSQLYRDLRNNIGVAAR